MAVLSTYLWHVSIEPTCFRYMSIDSGFIDISLVRVDYIDVS